MQFMDQGLEDSIPHEETEDGQGLTCEYANNLIMYLLSGFIFNELWEGDTSFNYNSLSFFFNMPEGFSLHFWWLK